jgi:hypothetical protein
MIKSAIIQYSECPLYIVYVWYFGEVYIACLSKICSIRRFYYVFVLATLNLSVHFRKKSQNFLRALNFALSLQLDIEVWLNSWGGAD